MGALGVRVGGEIKDEKVGVENGKLKDGVIE